MEHDGESDGVVVPLTPETTELRVREGPLLWVFRKRVRRSALRRLRSAGEEVRDLRKRLGAMVEVVCSSLGPDFPQESRVWENLTHGSMRGCWKPGMDAGTEAWPERSQELPPGS